MTILRIMEETKFATELDPNHHPPMLSHPLLQMKCVSQPASVFGVVRRAARTHRKDANGLYSSLATMKDQ